MKENNVNGENETIINSDRSIRKEYLRDIPDGVVGEKHERYDEKNDGRTNNKGLKIKLTEAILKGFRHR